MQKWIESHENVERIKNDRLTEYRTSSLYFGERKMHSRFYNETSSTHIHIHFACTFTTKPHYILHFRNERNNLDALIHIEGELDHDQFVWEIYQTVKQLYPQSQRGTQLELVVTICEECYVELEKFDSDHQIVSDQEAGMEITMSVIASPHICLSHRPYIEEICEKEAH